MESNAGQPARTSCNQMIEDNKRSFGNLQVKNQQLQKERQRLTELQNKHMEVENFRALLAGPNHVPSHASVDRVHAEMASLRQKTQSIQQQLNTILLHSQNTENATQILVTEITAHEENAMLQERRYEQLRDIEVGLRKVAGAAHEAGEQ